MQSVVRAATATNSCEVNTMREIEWKWNGPFSCTVFHTATPTATETAAVAPRWPKRSADQTSAGKTTYSTAVLLLNAITLSAATAATIAAASIARRFDSATRTGRDDQASARGTTTSAPDASPRNQVRQTVPATSAVTTFPSSDATVPIVALTIVPAAIAASIEPTPGTVSSGEPRRTRRRSTTAATTHSSTFPTVW